MIRASKNSSLHQRRSKLLRSGAHEREMGRGFGLKPVITRSNRQYHQSMPTAPRQGRGGGGGGGGSGGGCGVGGLGSVFWLIHEV